MDKHTTGVKYREIPFLLLQVQTSLCKTDGAPMDASAERSFSQRESKIRSVVGTFVPLVHGKRSLHQYNHERKRFLEVEIKQTRTMANEDIWRFGFRFNRNTTKAITGAGCSRNP